MGDNEDIELAEAVSEIRERFDLMADNEMDLIRLKCERLKEDWDNEFYV